MATTFKAIGRSAWSPQNAKPKGSGFSAEYKVFIPLEPNLKFRDSPTGKAAQAWRRYWKNLIAICKSFRKAGVRYEVEYHFGAEIAYANIYAGDACKQLELPLKEAA